VQAVGQQKVVTQHEVGWRYSEVIKWKSRQVCSWRQRLSPDRAAKPVRVEDE